jgi:hypothetical protein
MLIANDVAMILFGNSAETVQEAVNLIDHHFAKLIPKGTLRQYFWH